MPDRNKVIKNLEESISFFRDRLYGDKYEVWLKASFDALALLKAQEPVVMAGAELIDAELIEAIRKAPLVLKPNVDAAPVVRCRDCKHRPTDNRDSDDMTGFAIEFPDGKCPCQCEDGWYNWYPGDDWFCANGERRDDDGSID